MSSYAALALDCQCGNFFACPLTDGPSRLRRRFAGQRSHLTTLLSGKGWSHSWTRCILQPFSQTHWRRLDPLEACPAISPRAHRIDIHLQVARNLRITVPLCCGQHDPRPQDDLLLTSMASRHLFSFPLLFSTQDNDCGTLWHRWLLCSLASEIIFHMLHKFTYHAIK